METNHKSKHEKCSVLGLPKVLKSLTKRESERLDLQRLQKSSPKRHTPSTHPAQRLPKPLQHSQQTRENRSSRHSCLCNARQHGTQIKRLALQAYLLKYNLKLSPEAKGYLFLFTHPTLHNSKHSLPCIHTRKDPGGVQTLGKACPATTPGTGTYFLRGRRHNTFYGNLTIRLTNVK